MLVASFLRRLLAFVYVGIFVALGLFAALLTYKLISLASTETLPESGTSDVLFLFMGILMYATISGVGIVWSSAHVGGTWRRTHPKDFQHAWHLWATLILAHHNLCIPAHTPLCIHPRTLAIQGHPSPSVSRVVRRRIWRHTTHRLGLSLWGRIMLAHALRGCWTYAESLLYSPPSAHDRLESARIVRDLPVKWLCKGDLQHVFPPRMCA